MTPRQFDIGGRAATTGLHRLAQARLLGQVFFSIGLSILLGVHAGGWLETLSVQSLGPSDRSRPTHLATERIGETTAL